LARELHSLPLPHVPKPCSNGGSLSYPPLFLNVCLFPKKTGASVAITMLASKGALLPTIDELPPPLFLCVLLYKGGGCKRYHHHVLDYATMKEF